MPKLDFTQLLLATIEKKASDLHLTVGNPPMLRVHGSIQPLDGKTIPLTQEDLHKSLYDILTEEQRKRLERDKELDFALELKNVGRFRANMFYTRRGEGAAFRYIPTKIQSLGELGLPEDTLKQLCDRRKGLVLVTGLRVAENRQPLLPWLITLIPPGATISSPLKTQLNLFMNIKNVLLISEKSGQIPSPLRML